MRDPERPVACRNCGREHPAHDLDRAGWCPGCRAEVLRRARLAARGAAILAALAFGAWIATTVGSTQRFLVGWLVLVAATCAVTYKLVQRVAFEIIRKRGVPPPEA